MVTTTTGIHLSENEHLRFQDVVSTSESTKKTGELLQQNHERHHIFFNAMGFHNHIVHHLLTIWALGADEKDIQKHYDENLSYQRTLSPVDKAAVGKLSKTDDLSPYYGQGEHYPIILKYFTDRLQQSGQNWHEVIDQYLFARTPAADALLSRMYAGVLHPIIHFGYGIDFQQPAITAEGLASAVVHSDELAKLLLPAEAAAMKRGQGNQPSRSIVDLLDNIQNDEALLNCVRWVGQPLGHNGVLEKASKNIVDLTSQYRVETDELALRTAEMINAVAYLTAGAQRHDKIIKFDFFLIHCVNASIFWSAFIKQSWISDKDKVRLLEWKVRADLALYVSVKSPAIRLEDIRGYRPQKPSGWDEIRRRTLAISDDGHVAKLIRALEHGQQVCEPYADREEFRIKHDDWLQIGHMAIDSVKDKYGPRWIRRAGFAEAWAEIPARSRL